MSSCLIISTDAMRFGGMVRMARKCADAIDVLAVGNADLAQTLAQGDCDAVLHVPMGAGIPAEAAAATVRGVVEERKPRIIVCNDAPAARMLLGAAISTSGARVIDDVVDAAAEGPALVVDHRAPNRIATETYAVEGPVACIFTGDDADAPEGAQAASVTVVDAAWQDAKIVAEVPNEETGLANADKVVAVGMGVHNKEGLDAVQSLAVGIDAQVACSLPVCNDRHWFPPARVIGSSHNQCAPSLYMAFGISGSPNHMSGARDAKTIVAVNSDPDAPIFKVAQYGIVGDTEEVARALQSAFEKLS